MCGSSRFCVLRALRTSTFQSPVSAAKKAKRHRWSRVVFVLLLAVSAAAQDASTGAVKGTVLDASGGAIPDATVVLINVRTQNRLEPHITFHHKLSSKRRVQCGRETPSIYQAVKCLVCEMSHLGEKSFPTWEKTLPYPRFRGAPGSASASAS